MTKIKCHFGAHDWGLWKQKNQMTDRGWVRMLYRFCYRCGMVDKKFETLDGRRT